MENNLQQLVYTNDLFRENLELLIKERGITKKKISEDLDINEINLSRLCKKDNSQQPGIETLMKISKYFNISIDELIGENIKEKREQKRVKNERKDIKFCEKLITDTNENKLIWSKCYYLEDSKICDEILGYNPYDNSYFYSNKELGIECKVSDFNIVNTKIKEKNSLLPKIDVCILKIPYNIENESWIYEIYLKKEDGDVIKGGATCSDVFFGPELDSDLQKVMVKLYNAIDYYISFGKERFERDRIFDDYLNEGNISEDLAF